MVDYDNSVLNATFTRNFVVLLVIDKSHLLQKLFEPEPHIELLFCDLRISASIINEF